MVTGLAQAPLTRLRDSAQTLHRFRELLGQLVPSAFVERRWDPAYMRAVAAEPAAFCRRVDRLRGFFERCTHHCLAHDLRGLAPRLVGDQWARLGRVVVLHGTTPRGLAREPDQAEACELPDVVADVADRHAELLAELGRAELSLVEQ